MSQPCPGFHNQLCQPAILVQKSRQAPSSPLYCQLLFLDFLFRFGQALYTRKTLASFVKLIWCQTIWTRNACPSSICSIHGYLRSKNSFKFINLKFKLISFKGINAVQNVSKCPLIPLFIVVVLGVACLHLDLHVFKELIAPFASFITAL